MDDDARKLHEQWEPRQLPSPGVVAEALLGYTLREIGELQTLMAKAGFSLLVATAEVQTFTTDTGEP